VTVTIALRPLRIIWWGKVARSQKITWSGTYRVYPCSPGRVWAIVIPAPGFLCILGQLPTLLAWAVRHGRIEEILRLRLGGHGQGQSLRVEEWISIKISRLLQVLFFLYGFPFGRFPYFLDYRRRHSPSTLRSGLLILLFWRSCTLTAHPLYPSTIVYK
jgi:hypothetical protein